MERRFEVVFLEQAIEFMSKVDKKAKAKIYYNLDKAKLGLDPKLFKKLTDKVPKAEIEKAKQIRTEYFEQ